MERCGEVPLIARCLEADFERLLCTLPRIVVGSVRYSALCVYQRLEANGSCRHGRSRYPAECAEERPPACLRWRFEIGLILLLLRFCSMPHRVYLNGFVLG